MIRRKKKSAAHVLGAAPQNEDTTYYVRAEQPAMQPEIISQTSTETPGTYSAAANDVWTERHGNRTVELAVGLGWQVAIIYLSTPTHNASSLQSSDATAPSLPPRNLVSKTIKSRTTSLGLTTDDKSQIWTAALSKLIDGEYADEAEARRLAQDLHLGLVEALSVSGKYMRPAYELGRLLSEAVLLAAGADSREKPRIYRQLFDPLRLLPLAEWLASLEHLLPAGAAQAVFGSLQNWSRWIAKAEDADFKTADDYLREQARIWRDLLLGRVLAQDLSSDEKDPADDSYKNRSLSESLADISLAAAFNNRQSLYAEADAGTLKPDGLKTVFKATRLPKQRVTDAVGSRAETDRPAASEIKQLPLPAGVFPGQIKPLVSQDILPAEEDVKQFGGGVFPVGAEPSPPTIPISRFSLGVENKNRAAGPATNDGENPLPPSEEFRNSISSLADSLDGNSWVTKLSGKTEDLFYGTGNFEAADTTKTFFPENGGSSGVTLPPERHKKQHPGFDIDIYENFGSDFAPGFAPEFMSPYAKDDIKDLIRKDSSTAADAGIAPAADANLSGTQEQEPDLLPFDFDILQNFDIETIKPTFIHDNLTADPPVDTVQTQPNTRRPPDALSPGQVRQTPSVSRRRIKMLSLCFILFSLFFAARTFVARPVEVTQNALPPVIKAGQWVLVSKLAVTYQQGDIVYATKPGTDTKIFARIVALPGQAITSSDNTVYVNGTAVSNEKWYKETVGSCPRKSAASVPQEIIPKSYYVIMGSCSQFSSQNGIPNPVPERDISGKVIAVVWENSHPWFNWL